MKRIFWMACGFVWLGVAATAQPRLDFRDPLFGGVMRIIIDHAYPNAQVSLAAFVAGSDGAPDAAYPIGELPIGLTDASGTLYYDLVLSDRRWLDIQVSMIVSDDRADPSRWSTPVTFRVETAPSLLIATQDQAGGADLFQWPIGASEPSARFALGSGRPGGAVRDGRHQKIYAIADADQGLVRVFSRTDDSEGAAWRFKELQLGADLRGIALSPDGVDVLIVSGGGPSGSRLHRIDTRDDSLDEIGIDELGADGGRIVVGEDGTTAFVVIRGLFIRQIDLLQRSLGYLIAVGDPGQTEIRDLRIVQGNLFALTGRPVGAVPSDALTALELKNVGHIEQSSRLRLSDEIGVGRAASRDRELSPAIFVLDGGEGKVTVIDAKTMQLRREIPVPVGANSLLLTPDPAHSRGALLYGEAAAESALRTLDFAATSDLDSVIGERVELGFEATALPIVGVSSHVHRFALRAADGGIWLFDDELSSLEVPIPAGVDVVAISVD